MDDKWIDNIREKMSEFETTPPEGLWDAVQDRINSRKVKRHRLFPAAVAASAALLAGGYFAFLMDRPAIPERPALCSAGIKEEKTGDETPANDNSSLAKSIVQNNTGMTWPFAHENERIVECKTDRAGMSSESESTGHVASSIADIEGMDGQETTAEPEITSAANERTDDLYACTSEPQGDVALNGDSGKSRFIIGLATSADGMGGLMGDNDSRLDVLSSPTFDGSRMGGGLFSDSNSNNIPDQPTETAPIEVFDHKLPLRFSLNVSFPVTRNISFDTGLTYSYLKSDITFGDKFAATYSGRQKLHFIGIPASVRYAPLSGSHFACYVSGGAMVEKCVGGTIKGDDAHGIPYTYPGCEERPFQFSLNAALGLQYNISGECGIYLEPGVGFYPDNGSRLRTIYSERPLTFNLNIGIRFSRQKK